jgi:hypothetical protein
MHFEFHSAGSGGSREPRERYIQRLAGRLSMSSPRPGASAFRLLATEFTALHRSCRFPRQSGNPRAAAPETVAHYRTGGNGGGSHVETAHNCPDN